MSEADNLESLSNVELRAKLVKYDLPNVPVTDTSRNVLIKKLRMSITGANTPATASAKKSSRRETLAATERASPAKLTTENVQNRRTMTPTAKAKQTEELSNPGKISKLRRSKIHAGEEDRSKTSTHQKPLIPERRNAILTDFRHEDNDDDLILAAAEKVEEFNLNRRSSSRGASLSKTTLVTNSYGTNLITLPEEQPVVETLSTNVVRHKIAEVKSSTPQNVQEHLKQQREKHTAATGKIYEKYYGVKPSPVPYLSTISSSRLPYSLNNELDNDDVQELVANEQEYNEEAQLDTPFLSDFAKNLKRLKPDPLYGRLSQPRFVQEVSGRASLHRPYNQRGHTSITRRFSNWIRRSYWLLHLLLVIILLALTYIILQFWQ